MKHLVILLVVFLLAGCRATPNDPDVESDGQLVVRFYVTDAAGQPARSFRFGDEIFFEYHILNNTGTDQPWSGLYQPSVVDVALWTGARGELRVGSTNAGRTDYGEEPRSGILRAGETMTHRTSWTANLRNFKPPVGEYVAIANLALTFDDLPRYESPRVPLTVLPPTEEDRHVMGLFYGPLFGFCPREGLYTADVLRKGKGPYRLVGTRLVERKSDDDDCLPGLGPGCLKQLPFGPIILTQAQAVHLVRLIGSFPAGPPEVYRACDPCAVLVYRFTDADRMITPCMMGPPSYIEKALQVKEYIESLID